MQLFFIVLKTPMQAGSETASKHHLWEGSFMQIFAHFNISPRSLHSHVGGRKVNIMVVGLVVAIALAILAT